MTLDEYMSISCYPWMEQMQSSDSVIHMMVRLQWITADLSPPRHLESLVPATLHAMAREIILPCDTTHKRTWWTALEQLRSMCTRPEATVTLSEN
jgi:hypothetical protein